ncbi:MAG: hypothetical protein RTV41_03270 [Candidatus Thorarchaeota archaeon]
MNNSLDPKREARRAAIKGLARVTITSNLDQELVEDIVAAAPEVQILYIDLQEDTIVELSILSPLKDLLVLKIQEGPKLQSISLDGIQELKLLTGFEINVNPEESIEEIDLTPLANHPDLRVVTIACPSKNLKGLEALRTIPNLESIGLYSLDISELDISPLSGCKKLESIYIGDLGPETPTKPYRIELPRDIPLKILEVSECYSDELKLDIDFSFIQDIRSLDSLKLVNCNLTSFDFKTISSLERLGSINLSENKITHLDITPIIGIPTFTEKTLGDPPFVIDPDVIIQIEKNRREDVSKILEMPDAVVEDHEGIFAIENEFGHQWLKTLLCKHTVDWIKWSPP